MEEKILAKLDSMQNQIMHEMNQKMDDLKASILGEVKQEIKEEVSGIKKDVDGIKQKVDSLQKEFIELKEDVQVVSDQMVVLENDYGRKINIMYEELTARNERTEALEKNWSSTQKRVDKNSAFIFSHENRIATLEKAKQ